MTVCTVVSAEDGRRNHRVEPSLTTSSAGRQGDSMARKTPPACANRRHAMAFLPIFVGILALCGRVKSDCPGLNPKTAVVECKFAGQNVPCEQTQRAGTVATFSCKAFHTVLYNLSPASGYTSVCRRDGSWSTKPLRCHPECGVPTGNGIPHVLGGKPVDSTSQFPWHVIVYLRNHRDFGYDAICGGSLIKPKYFVSAAHCFFVGNATQEPITSNYIAAFGKMFRRLDHSDDVRSQIVNISKIHLSHYGGEQKNYLNDIALVELESEVVITSSTIPVCVDWEGSHFALMNQQKCTVVGWGKSPLGQYDELRFAEMTYTARNECQHLVPTDLQAYATMDDKFCVAVGNDTNVAKGDSGGGLTVRTDSKWFLRGVVSVGGPTRKFAIFSNVTYFTQWMASIIQEGEGWRCGVSDEQPRPGASLDGKHGFPWSAEVYLMDGHTATPFTEGVLVQHNLVVTASWDRFTDKVVDPIRPSSLRVAIGRKGTGSGFKDAVHVSKVKQILYPEELIKSSFLYSVALIELESPIAVMPACVDWELERAHEMTSPGFTIQRTPDGDRQWRQLSLLNSTKCKLPKRFKYMNHYNLCANITGADPQAAATSNSTNDVTRVPEVRTVMQRVGGVWFLRAVLGIELADGFLTFTDVIDPHVMEWMAKTRGVVGKAECGVSALKGVPFDDSVKVIHMPWNVDVRVRGADGERSIAGVLIQNNVVLTGDYDRSEAGGENLDPGNVTVAIKRNDGTTQKIAVVKVSTLDYDWTWDWDVSHAAFLLQLKKGVQQMPACIDLTGVALQPLTSQQRGLVETFSGGSENQNGAAFVDWSDCSSLLKEQNEQLLLPTDALCINASRELLPGTGFLTVTADRWYLRGLRAKQWQHQKRLNAFVDLSHKAVLQWLREALKTIPPGAVSKDNDGSMSWVDSVIVPNIRLTSERPAARPRTAPTSTTPTTPTGRIQIRKSRPLVLLDADSTTTTNNNRAPKTNNKVLADDQGTSPSSFGYAWLATAVMASCAALVAVSLLAVYVVKKAGRRRDASAVLWSKVASTSSVVSAPPSNARSSYAYAW